MIPIEPAPPCGVTVKSATGRGTVWVEVGVAVTVCGVMLKIFYMFASRGDSGE